MLLSHNCDLLHKDQYLIAKMKLISSLPENELTRGMDGNIRKYRTNALFYVPSLSDKFEESFIHYGFSIAILKSYFEDKIKAGQVENMISLSNNAKRLILLILVAVFRYVIS